MTDASATESSRVFWGWILTGAWAILVSAYVFGAVGIVEFMDMDPNEHGDFFAGVFAPLAFLWLVIGYFQQGAELKDNTNALLTQSEEAKNLAEQAKAQAEGIKANEEHARRDTLMRVANLLERDLNHYSLNICQALLNADGTQRVLERYKAGDFYAFQDVIVKRIIADAPRDNDNLTQPDKKPNSDVRRYVAVYEKLLRTIDKCDDSDSALRKEYEWCPLGHAYSELTKSFNLDHKMKFGHRAKAEKAARKHSVEG